MMNVQTPTSSRKGVGGLADLHTPAELHLAHSPSGRVSFLDVPITKRGCLRRTPWPGFVTPESVSNLNLHGLAVPTDALKSLASMPTLTSLDLMSSPAVTAAAVPLYWCLQTACGLLAHGGMPAPEGAVMITAPRPAADLRDS